MSLSSNVRRLISFCQGYPLEEIVSISSYQELVPFSDIEGEDDAQYMSRVFSYKLSDGEEQSLSLFPTYSEWGYAVGSFIPNTVENVNEVADFENYISETSDIFFDGGKDSKTLNKERTYLLSVMQNIYDLKD